MPNSADEVPARRIEAAVEPLAERINAEHRACKIAAASALGHMEAFLEHALAAGELLREARAQVPYGDWEDWLGANFEGSVRRAQEYMQVASNRAVLEEAKARGSAFSSIEGALRLIRSLRPPRRPARRELMGGPDPFPHLSPEQEARRKRTAREEERLARLAEHAIRTGSWDHTPADVSPGAWESAVWRALNERAGTYRSCSTPSGTSLTSWSTTPPPRRWAGTWRSR
jgi:hypothetical protein